MVPVTDPFEIFTSMVNVHTAWMKYFPEFISRMTELNRNVQEMILEEFGRILSGVDGNQKLAQNENEALMDVIRQTAQTARKYHQILSQWLKKAVEDTPDVDSSERQKANFWMGQLIHAMAPSNYFWTNPGAVQRFLASNGESLKRGLHSWAEDVQHRDSLVQLVQESAFKVGENLAVTPGEIVFRNELMELIQYAPAAERVYPVPIVMIQPWINKYYIFDLSPANSFVRYLIRKGFTVFITSWKNPTPDMRHITFDDYMLNGARAAIDAARTICGAEQVHATGYCIGGTALAALMAWLNRGSQSEPLPVIDWTIFAALADFSEPGDLAVYMGESAIEAIEKLTQADGYLDAKYISLAFRLLNSDALIWRYVVNNYLYGDPPPKSDMLYWNCDSTRLPQAMCSVYLKEFYLNNKLIQPDAMILGGRPIDLGRITQPLYAVGAMQDHISPWKGTFKICHRVSGPVRYVLANEGHITGIVNPPSAVSKKKFWASDPAKAEHPDQWLADQEIRKGSWWEDWIEWLVPRSGVPGQAPPMGCDRYPPLEKAPGRYVLER